MKLLGLHHVTAICSDAQKNADFYSGVLGLRVTKVTVNFDDPQSYHLYYGNADGSPGTNITFFVWPGGRRGRIGPSQVATTAYSIERASLDFWQQRFADRGVACSEIGVKFGEPFFRVEDPDGMVIELVGVDGELPPGYETSGIEPQHTLRAFHSVTLLERVLDATAEAVTKHMDFVEHSTEGDVIRYAIDGGGPGKWIDVHFDATKPAGHQGAGIVHHVAFRTPDDASEKQWQERLHDAGLHVSPQMERTYFRSIYFREPGGVLFEIATDGPGFAVDEEGGIGRSLRIPPWYEEQRAAILAGLPKFKAAGIEYP